MSEGIPASEGSETPEEVNPNESMKRLDQALQYGTIDDVWSLFDQGMDINQTDFEGRTALQLMSFRGSKEVVEQLIARGADVNQMFLYQGRVPMTALDAAREANKTEVVELLLTNGAKTGKEVEHG